MSTHRSHVLLWSSLLIFFPTSRNTWEWSLVIAGDPGGWSFPDRGDTVLQPQNHEHAHSLQPSQRHHFPTEKQELLLFNPAALVNGALIEHCPCPSQKYFIAEIGFSAHQPPFLSRGSIPSCSCNQVGTMFWFIRGNDVCATSGPYHQRGSVISPCPLFSLQGHGATCSKGRVDTNDLDSQDTRQTRAALGKDSQSWLSEQWTFMINHWVYPTAQVSLTWDKTLFCFAY